MLELKNTTKILSNRPILRNVNLSVSAGEIVALIGPNGAGKSTAFKCITGLMKPTNGTISINGQTLKNNPIKYKKQIGYLGHESFLYEAFTPLENLKFFGKIYQTTNIEKTALELLEKVGLYRFRNIRIESFSRGMIQRLAIARMLMSEPDLLLLDEPHTGLDQGAITLLNEIIKEKQTEGKSLVIITHDFEQVLSLCNYVIVLHHGRVVAEKPVVEESLGSFRNWYAEAVSGK